MSTAQQIRRRSRSRPRDDHIEQEYDTEIQDVASSRLSLSVAPTSVLDAQQQRIDAIRSVLQSERLHLQQLNTRFAEFINQQNLKSGQDKQMNQRYQQLLEDHERTIESKNHRSMIEVEALNKINIGLTARMGKLQNQLDIVKNESDVYQSEIGTLNVQINSYKNELESLYADVDTLQNQRDQLLEQLQLPPNHSYRLTDVLNQVRELQAQLQQQADLVDRFKEEAMSINKDKIDLESQLKRQDIKEQKLLNLITEYESILISNDLLVTPSQYNLDANGTQNISKSQRRSSLSRKSFMRNVVDSEYNYANNNSDMDDDDIEDEDDDDENVDEDNEEEKDCENNDGDDEKKSRTGGKKIKNGKKSTKKKNGKKSNSKKLSVDEDDVSDHEENDTIGNKELLRECNSITRDLSRIDHNLSQRCERIFTTFQSTQHQLTIEKHNELTQQQQDLTQQFNKQNKTLKTQNDGLTKQLNFLKTQQVELENDIQRLNIEVDALNKQVVFYQNQAQEYQDRDDESQRIIEELEEQIQQKNDEFTSLKTSHVFIKQQLQRYEQLLTAEEYRLDIRGTINTIDPELLQEMNETNELLTIEDIPQIVPKAGTVLTTLGIPSAYAYQQSGEDETFRDKRYDDHNEFLAEIRSIAAQDAEVVKEWFDQQQQLQEEVEDEDDEEEEGEEVNDEDYEYNEDEEIPSKIEEQKPKEEQPAQKPKKRQSVFNWFFGGSDDKQDDKVQETENVEPNDYVQLDNRLGDKYGLHDDSQLANRDVEDDEDDIQDDNVYEEDEDEDITEETQIVQEEEEEEDEELLDEDEDYTDDEKPQKQGAPPAPVKRSAAVLLTENFMDDELLDLGDIAPPPQQQQPQSSPLKQSKNKRQHVEQQPSKDYSADEQNPFAHIQPQQQPQKRIVSRYQKNKQAAYQTYNNNNNDSQDEEPQYQQQQPRKHAPVRTSILISGIDEFGQYIKISNGSDTTLSLAGWSLVTHGRNYRFLFPEEAILPAQGSFIMRTIQVDEDMDKNDFAPDEDNNVTIYINHDLWTAEDDRCILYNDAGKEKASVRITQDNLPANNHNGCSIM